MATIPKGLPFEVEDVEAVPGGGRIVARLLVGYCDYLTSQLALLKEAAQNGRLREVHRIAHAIRGGALTIGATELADAAENLEKVSKRSTSPLIPELVSTVEGRTNRFIRATHKYALGCDRR